jgi:hypothetical protein
MAINPDHGYVLLMCNKDWPHVVYWNGQDPSAVAIGGSPANIFTLCTYQACVVGVINGTNTLRWSDPGTIDTWPADSELTVDTKWGYVTNLIALDDKILIFCDKGILYLTGDIMDQPHIGILHPEIGAQRSTAEQYGSTVAFAFAQNIYLIDGSISLSSDPIRDSIVMPAGTHLGLNSEYIYVYPNPYQGGYTNPPGDGVDVYVMERTRQGFWSKYTFSNSTGVGFFNTGGAAPTNSFVKYISYPWDCFAFAGTFGDLYVQPIPGKYPAATDNDISATGGNYIPVKTVIETRPLDFTDRVLTKQFRRGIIYGSGSGITVKMFLTDKNKIVSEITPGLSSTELPCQFTLPTADGSAGSDHLEFQELSFYIEGYNLEVQNIELEFKPIRYNLLTFD